MNITEQFKQIFEPELLKEFEQKAKPLSVKANDTILDIGQTVRVIPIVLSGTLKISRIDEDGHELLLYYVSSVSSSATAFTSLGYCCIQQVKVMAQLSLGLT